MHNVNLCSCSLCEYKRNCYETMNGTDPAAFVAKARELVQERAQFGYASLPGRIGEAIRELAALLPPETP